LDRERWIWRSIQGELQLLSDPNSIRIFFLKKNKNKQKQKKIYKKKRKQKKKKNE